MLHADKPTIMVEETTTFNKVEMAGSKETNTNMVAIAVDGDLHLDSLGWQVVLKRQVD